MRGVVENAYRYHDLMLGRLVALAGSDCAVMLISDHGFHSDKLLPDYIPAEAAGPAVEHRSFGIFCMRGPGYGSTSVFTGQVCSTSHPRRCICSAFRREWIWMARCL